jgi:hypothetical protein
MDQMQSVSVLGSEECDDPDALKLWSQIRERKLAFPKDSI